MPLLSASAVVSSGTVVSTIGSETRLGAGMHIMLENQPCWTSTILAAGGCVIRFISAALALPVVGDASAKGFTHSRISPT